MPGLYLRQHQVTSKCGLDRLNRISRCLWMLFQLDVLQMRLGQDVLVEQIRFEKAEQNSRQHEQYGQTRKHCAFAFTWDLISWTLAGWNNVSSFDALNVLRNSRRVGQFSWKMTTCKTPGCVHCQDTNKQTNAVWISNRLLPLFFFFFLTPRHVTHTN